MFGLASTRPIVSALFSLARYTDTSRFATAHRSFTPAFHSWFLLALGFALLLGYAVIAKLYFFTAPFRGVMLAVALYLFGIGVNLAQSKFR